MAETGGRGEAVPSTATGQRAPFFEKARDFYLREIIAWEQTPLTVRTRVGKEHRDALSYAKSACERLPR